MSNKKNSFFSFLSFIKKLPAKHTLKLVSKQKLAIEKSFPLGIDFGITAIKLVQISIIEGKLQITNIIIKEIPLELWNSPLQRKKAIPEILKKIVQEYKIRGGVITSLPSSSVQMKTVKLPPMPKEEIAKAIEWEVKQSSTIDLKDLSFDYYLLDEHKIAPSREIEAMVVSCSKKDVLEQMAMVRAANLTPLAIETDSVAGVCALIHGSQIKMGEVILFLEFGCHSCSISIVMDNNIHFKRELAINGDLLTQAIAKHCNLPYNNAERLKHTYGLMGTNSSRGDLQTPEGESAIMVNEALWLQLENIIQEIDYTFKYFTHQFTSGRISKIDRIIISGGSANLNNFHSYLNSYLNVPVEIADPLRQTPLNSEISSKFDNLESLKPRLSVAMGLALKEL